MCKKYYSKMRYNNLDEYDFKGEDYIFFSNEKEDFKRNIYP